MEVVFFVVFFVFFFFNQIMTLIQKGISRVQEGSSELPIDV